MGLFDSIKSTVITEYKADTKDMRSGLKKLKGAELERHKALIDQTEAQNKRLDGQIAMWGKVALGVGAVVGAYKVLTAAHEVYAKNSKLAATTTGVNLDGLRKATQGLVDDTRLLQFASSAMNGTFKLSQSEMENSLKGVIALRNEGNELNKTLDNVEKSVKEGTTEPLKELGHVIKGVENDTREGLNAALKDLTDTARKAGPDLRRPGDEMTAASVEMENAVDALMHSLGALAESLAPVIKQMATMVGLLVSAGNAVAFLMDQSQGNQGTTPLQDNMRKLMADAKRQGADLQLDPSIFGDTVSGGPSGRGGGGFDFMMRETRSGFDFDASNDNLARGPYFDPHIQGRKKGSGSGEFSIGGIQLEGGIGGPNMAAGYTGKNSLGHQALADERAELMQQVFDRKGMGAAGNEAAQMALDTIARMEKLEQDREASIFANLFGTPAEIDAQTMALEQLAGTFDGFAGAFGAGVDALITGSKGFGEAFKDAIGESLRAMAVEMSISALKHTAYGLASLAFMDGRGAAAHFAAAGGFAAGAIAAGGGARLLGAGQAQSAGAPSTAGTAGVGTSGGASNDNGGGGSTQVFIVGNDFAGLPARQRESQWRQISRSAGVSIDGDVVVNG